MKKLFYLFIFYVIAVSCTKTSNNPTETFLTGNGVFILNEGNFTWGNGSLSFYSYDSSKIYNNLFMNINERPLGDVPNSMNIKDDRAYIVVNNSGKIEVINKNTLESVATINGLTSPRNIAFTNNNTAYVTSMYSDTVKIISLIDNTISGYIDLKRYSESIVISGSKAFISNMLGPQYVSGNEILVVNTENNEVVDYITVGFEPESMVIDKNKMLWVLCNGGLARDNFARMVAINTLTNSIEKNIEFPTITTSPSCLRIDGKGETLYYLENGVHSMNIGDTQLPTTPLIPESTHYFYKLGINPENSDIFITDAVDYQQKGYLLYYQMDGTFVSEQNANIIPGFMNFKVEP